MKTRHLIHFLAVAETGSFRQAGKRLDLGQSTVSRQVRHLEETLGVSLFERRTTGVLLTWAGVVFAEHARLIVNDFQIAVDAVKANGVAVSGRLRVGMIASLSHGPLRAVVEQFLAEHGGVSLSFIESDRSELLTMLSHRRIDFVFAAGDPEAENGDGIILCEENIYLAVAADSELANRSQLDWSDIEKSQFIVGAREPGPEIHDYIVRRITDLGRSARLHHHQLDREGIMTLVGLGMGVSLVADHWRGVKYPNVTFVPIGDQDERVPFSLTWRPENDNPALRRFLSLARIEAKKNGAPS